MAFIVTKVCPSNILPAGWVALQGTVQDIDKGPAQVVNPGAGGDPCVVERIGRNGLFISGLPADDIETGATVENI